MFTVNLEKEMVAGKKTTKDEIQVLKEFEAIMKENQDKEIEVLERIGLNKNLLEAGTAIGLNNTISKYDKQRIFHVSEIRKICGKYGLRFLDTQCYKGTLDPYTPVSIINFETQYPFPDPITDKCKGYSYKIMAPKSSFKLEPFPKDPLLFAKIADEYYYLVHKWGDDLNKLRKYTQPFKRAYGVPLVTTLVLLFISVVASKDRPVEVHNMMVIFGPYLKYFFTPVLIITFLIGRSLLADDYDSRFESDSW